MSSSFFKTPCNSSKSCFMDGISTATCLKYFLAIVILSNILFDVYPVAAILNLTSSIPHSESCFGFSSFN